MTTLSGEDCLSLSMQELLIWRLGGVDGFLHTLKEASERSGVPIQQIALAERALTNRIEKL
jgi:hypothetical protein